MPSALVAALELVAWIVGGTLVWWLVCGPKKTASERRDRALRLVNQSLDEEWALAVPRIVGQQTQYGRRITKHS